MFSAKYKNKWHKITDVEKCDDLITYQLEGIGGKVKASEVEDMDKTNHEIQNPDGSVTRGPGKEPLMKPMKKSLNERWKLLKAKLDHSTAIQSLMDDDDDEEDGDQASGEDQQQQEQPGMAGQNVETNPQQEASAPEEEPGQSQQPGPGADDGADSDSKEDENNQPVDYDEDKLTEALKADGYTDAEIAHVIHGHVPTPPTKDQLQAIAQQQVLGHKEASHEQTLDHKQTRAELEHEHAKRQLDLEHEHSKKEKEIRLKYLEQELATKIEALKSKGKE